MDYEINGVPYASLESYLMTGKLGFCSCGDPESVLKLFYDYLLIAKNKEISFEEIEKRIDALLIDRIREFRLILEYILDKNELTEHGGSVYGSWLFDYDFIEKLNLWHEKEYSE